MKAEILKIAGVKSEKDFYSKYPDEASFMKVHGKAFKKAKLGTSLQSKGQLKKLDQLTSFTNDVDGMIPQAVDGIYGGPGPRFLKPQPFGDLRQYMFDDYPQEPAIKYTASIQKPAQDFSMNKNPLVNKGLKTENKDYNAGAYVQAGTDIIQGLGELKQEKEQRREAEQNAALTNVQGQAAGLREQPINRKYVRPEDIPFNPEQLSPSYGVGTNYLAKDGTMMRGNRGEIQNTYAPNNLYDDLGYEPLGESSQVKQFQYGGMFGNQGVMNFSKEGGTDLAGNIGGMIGSGSYTKNAGSKVGGGVGQGLGTALGGPVGGMVGKFAGSLIGGALDKNGKLIEKFNKESEHNIGNVMSGYVGRGIQNQYNSYMEDGGWVSHDWQPQVITQFGGHNLKDLLADDPMMDTLRTGGSIRQNNIYPQDQYALGGELQTTWGGVAEPISHNPYLPGTGETVMFRGNSHDEGDGNGHTGIGVKYGMGGKMTDYAEFGTEQADADVEVEKGEPATEMIDDKTGEKNMVVYGNLKIPNEFLEAIGDPKAKGRKFKHYIADISKDEEKQNKIIDKHTKLINANKDLTPIDELSFNGSKASIIGANMKLKENAEIKKNAAIVQNAINDTTKELSDYLGKSVITEDLLKGKLKFEKGTKTAKWGTNIKKAQSGIFEPLIPNHGLPTKPVFGMKDVNFPSTLQPRTNAMDFPSTLQPIVNQQPSVQGTPTGVVTIDATGNVTNVPNDIPGTLSEKFANTEKSALAKLKALYPGKSVEIKLAIGDRDITTQRGYRGSGASQTDVSIHNLGGARDYNIIIDGKVIHDKSVYSNTLHAAAKENGLYNLNWEKDPYHISAVKEGSGNSYANLLKKYPYLKNTETYKNTVKYLDEGFKNKQLTKGELAAYKQITGKDISGITPYNPDYKAASQAMGNPEYEYTPATAPEQGSNRIWGNPEYGQRTSIMENQPPELPGVSDIPVKKNKIPWMPFANAAISQLRPSDAEQLNPNQLTGEMYALSQNQLEPVSAQLYHPQLDQPYDISYQELLNANQADFNAIQRQAGGNPEALMALAASKYGANSSVLGQQFKANQANKAAIYSKNRDLLNEAQLKNLGILDNQYVRQAQAKSNTKDVTQAALNSISSKIAQNKLQNRELAVYENLYNYRYNDMFKAVNMNPLQEWNTQVPGAEETTTAALTKAKIAKGDKPATKSTGRNGNIVKAIKNL